MEPTGQEPMTPQLRNGQEDNMRQFAELPTTARGVRWLFAELDATRDALVASRSELSRLQKDGERLDWLDKRLPNVIVFGGSRVSIFAPNKSDLLADLPIGYGPTFRIALDAARASTAETNNG